MQQTIDRLTYVQGGIAGLAGGIAMAMAAMMFTAFLGMGLWAMPQMIAGLAVGQAATAGGPGIIMLGLMIHMMLSVMFGVIYAVIVKAATRELWFTGLGYGIALWVVNLHLLARFLPAARVMAQNEPLWLAAMTHMIFGLVTAGIAAVLSRRATTVASA
jgi:uncharacterized membrane protein YagU involved in acid resistance